MKRIVLKQHDATLPDLHRAAARGDLGAMRKAMASGGTVHQLDPIMGASALHMAALGGSVEAIDLLLDAGALPNVQAHCHGMTPLMVAVWHRNPGVVERLLAHPGIDVGMRSRMGATAEELIGGFVADQPANDSDDRIRRHFADWRAARPDRPMIAVLEDATLSLDEKTARVVALLANGADPDEVANVSNPHNPGHSAVLIAARDGMTDIVKALLEAGADIRLADHFMLAHAAHKAAYNGHADVMRLLAGHSDFGTIADIQGPFNGYTALHDAAWHGHEETVGVLLDAGVQRDLVGYDGRTAAELARHNGHDGIATLIEAG